MLPAAERGVLPAADLGVLPAAEPRALPATELGAARGPLAQGYAVQRHLGPLGTAGRHETARPGSGVQTAVAGDTRTGPVAPSPAGRLPSAAAGLGAQSSATRRSTVALADRGTAPDAAGRAPGTPVALAPAAPTLLPPTTPAPAPAPATVGTGVAAVAPATAEPVVARWRAGVLPSPRPAPRPGAWDLAAPLPLTRPSDAPSMRGRGADAAPPDDALAVDPSPAEVPAPAPPASDPPGAQAPEADAPAGGPADFTAEQLDVLARRLLPALTRRLRAEVLLDRERRGRRTDGRWT
ncbi:hypothetical protein [Georgenia faecalis]|uniref:hypothetical protein n=1 Tax=Georgenia faecalis TaxID=2483799 RepID=UPI000FDB7BF6|nr:hypothetical protein [Georgenia faecalis]